MVKNDVNLGIKIPQSERDAFHNVCEKKGVIKSKVLRRLMEMFVKGEVKL